MRVLVTLLKRPLLKHTTPRAPTQCTDLEEKLASKDLEEEVALAIIALARMMECGVLQPLMRLRGVEAALARVVSHPAPPPLVWQETWHRFTGPESGNIDWKLSIHFHRSCGLCLAYAALAYAALACAALAYAAAYSAALLLALSLSLLLLRLHALPWTLRSIASHALYRMPAIVGCILTP